MFYRHNRHYKIFCVNGNTGFKFESRIFYFIHLQNEENFMKEKNQVVPDHIRPKIISVLLKFSVVLANY